MLKFISVGFWTLLGPSRGLFKTTLLWSLTFFDGFLGPLCCHLWRFLGPILCQKRVFCWRVLGQNFVETLNPTLKRANRTIDLWRNEVNRTRIARDMTFHVNGEKNHCNGWSLTSIFWAAIAAMNKHHSVLGDIVSAAVMQNVNTFETRKNGLYSISERKRAFFTISPTRKNGDNCTAKNNFKVSDEG